MDISLAHVHSGRNITDHEIVPAGGIRRPVSRRPRVGLPAEYNSHFHGPA